MRTPASLTGRGGEAPVVASAPAWPRGSGGDRDGSGSGSSGSDGIGSGGSGSDGSGSGRQRGWPRRWPCTREASLACQPAVVSVAREARNHAQWVGASVRVGVRGDARLVFRPEASSLGKRKSYTWLIPAPEAQTVRRGRQKFGDGRRRPERWDTHLYPLAWSSPTPRDARERRGGCLTPTFLHLHGHSPGQPPVLRRGMHGRGTVGVWAPCLWRPLTCWSLTHRVELCRTRVP